MILPLLLLRIYSRRKSTEKNSSQNARQTMYWTDPHMENWQNETRRTERGGA
jgi:hypothetical protein